MEQTILEKVQYWWNGKTNNSFNIKKLKKKLEELGHTDVHVWWEPIGLACEMCGNEGGYAYLSNLIDVPNSLGYSFKEAMENLNTNNWHNTKYELFYEINGIAHKRPIKEERN